MTGFWFPFREDSDSHSLQPFSQRVDISGQFLENTAVVCSLLLLFALTHFAISLYGSLSAEGQNLDDSEDSKWAAAKKVLYECCVFPLTAGFCIVMLLSGFTNNMRRASAPGQPLLVANSLSVLSAWLTMGWVFCTELLQSSKGRGYVDCSAEKQTKCWYISAFLGRSLLFANLTEAAVLLGAGKTLYAVAGCQLGYLLIVVVCRPYESLFQQVGVLTCELSLSYSLGLALLRHFYASS